MMVCDDKRDSIVGGRFPFVCEERFSIHQLHFGCRFTEFSLAVPTFDEVRDILFSMLCVMVYMCADATNAYKLPFRDGAEEMLGVV